MQGIEILNKTEVMIFNDDLVIIGLMLLGVAFILGGVMTKVENIVIKYIILGGFGLCLLSTLIITIVYKEVKIPSGRYQYEAVIQNDVSINEVYKHYKVIEQKGKIWILEDKE